VTVFGIFASVVDGRVGVQDIENDDVNASTQKSFHTKATQIKELLRGHMTLSTVPTKDPLPPGHPPGPSPFDDNLIAHASDNAGIRHKTDEKRLIKIFDNNVMDSALASNGMAFPNAHISHEEGEKPCLDTYNSRFNWDWCQRRALMGTCTSTGKFYGYNSTFMSTNCCEKCGIMADDPDSLCENLHTNNMKCDQWATGGECSANSLWMHNECCRSCAEKCVDNTEDCPLSARGGGCASLATKNDCCHSCMLMDAAPSLVRLFNGDTCEQDNDCASGRCKTLGLICAAKLPDESNCLRDNDCISDNCRVAVSASSLLKCKP